MSKYFLPEHKKLQTVSQSHAIVKALEHICSCVQCLHSYAQSVADMLIKAEACRDVICQGVWAAAKRGDCALSYTKTCQYSGFGRSSSSAACNAVWRTA